MLTQNIQIRFKKAILETRICLLLYEEKFTREENLKMGYAIFTARKLMLTNRINQVNFRIMQLSQQQQSLAQAAGDKQRCIAWAKNMFSTIGNSLTSGIQMNMMGMSNSIMSNLGIKQGDTLTDEQQKQMQAEMEKEMKKSYLAMAGTQNFFNGLSQMIDFSTQNELRNINNMENQIELERKNLETQVKAMTAELESVEKAEDNAIKNSAPKFA